MTLKNETTANEIITALKPAKKRPSVFSFVFRKKCRFVPLSSCRVSLHKENVIPSSRWSFSFLMNFFNGSNEYYFYGVVQSEL